MARADKERPVADRADGDRVFQDRAAGDRAVGDCAVIEAGGTGDPTPGPPNPRQATLLVSLLRERRLARSSPQGSPEWAAAMAGAEELQQELDGLEAGGEDDASALVGEGTTLLHIGPLVLADGQRVEGTVAGPAESVDDVRRAASVLAHSVATRQAFLTDLERLTAEHGYALETSEGEWDVVLFYVYDSREHAG